MIGREFRQQASPYLSGKVDAFATTLLGIVLKAYGPEALNWDGLTIQLQIKEDFEIDLPRRVHDKIMALILCMTSNRVFIEVPVFDEMISALAGQGVGYEQDVPPVEDVAWACTEILLNDPEPTGRPPMPWSSDIRKYVRVVLDDEGMPIAPEALSFAKDTTVKTEENVTGADYAATWEIRASRAREVDEWIEARVVLLLDQLQSLGIDVAVPT